MSNRFFIFRGAVSLVTVVATAILSSMVAPASAQTLTDIVLFRTDADGNSVAEGWNTRGGDFVSNLYLTNGGNTINSGNGVAASVAINLSVPGTYTFNFAGENVNTNTAPQLAVNFFFNNDAATPRISARGIGTGAFSALGGAVNTSTPSFGTAPGSGSLSYANNGLLITLSAYTYQTTSGADLVTSFNDAPGGTTDSVGSFTLTVAPVTVPEASPLTLLGLGSVVGVIALRRRK